MTKRVDLALLPAEALAIRANCYVVVDVLRATTTIATLFAAGLENLIVTDSTELARERAAGEGRLLFGETGGLRPEGFDYGNSPVEARRAPVEGRGAVLFTTNGTRALCALAEHGAVISGAIANVSATVAFVAEHEHVVVVCAGEARGERFAQEDFAAAGSIAARITAAQPETQVGDAARLAILAVSGGAGALVRESHHGLVLAELGFGADIDFALLPDTSRAVPLVSACGQGWALLRNAGG